MEQVEKALRGAVRTREKEETGWRNRRWKCAKADGGKLLAEHTPQKHDYYPYK